MMKHARILQIDPLEPRRLFAAQPPLGINFVDEAMFEENFATALQHAQSLGVTSVRMWFGYESLSDRPNAWDPVYPYGTLFPEDNNSLEPLVNQTGQVMKRAFQLHDAGMSVMLVFNDRQGDAPESSEAVRGFFRHMMDSTEHPGGTRTLKDVVDYWQIGNEVDASLYWKRSADGKTSGIRRYVNELLIPAAQELKTGANETVVSGSVSWNPTDLKTILEAASTAGKLGLIDHAGYHPYGTYDPDSPSGNQIATRTANALSVGRTYGKSLVASEWNVRGFGTNGSRNAEWAAAMDTVYRETIRPNYHQAYYFALINNWAARGGNVSARPAGLLKHESPVSVTPESSIDDLRTYYTSPLVPAEPFYSTFKGWRTPATPGTLGSISGVLFNDTNANGSQDSDETRTGVRTVYLDDNRNGRLDSGERSVQSDSRGAYQFAGLGAGTYQVSRVFPSGYRLSNNDDGYITITLPAGGARDGVNLGSTDKPTTLVPPVPQTGVISGILWNDSDADGVLDSDEGRTGVRTVYLDANRNGRLDSGERSVQSDSRGAYAFTGLAAGTYYVSRVFPSGWNMSNNADGYLTVTVAAGETFTGANIGTTDKIVAVPPTGPNTPGDPRTASISGFLWNDANGDGVVDSSESRTGTRTVFIDTNRNGKLDWGEASVSSNSSGVYSFFGLAAGTYYVSRVYPSGWRMSNDTAGYLTITVGAGQALGGVNIGTTDKPVVA